MPFRIGFGYDVHQLAPGLPLNLGGIRIPHTHGCVAHSDGDVVIHALCDAMLGALALRDIGFHFPDTDPAYKGIDSKKLLTEVNAMIRRQDYIPGNVDISIAMQKPRLSEFIPDMLQALADCLGIDVSRVSVKATTTEKLGFVGEEKGVEAYAVVLLQAIG